MPAQSALDGVRVVDFGQYIAGPMAAMLLADHGADVIRIEPPGGPRYRTAANATWNRGKRSIVLDLKDAQDLETAWQLAASADVLIENFRPGVMDRLGLGAQLLGAQNPGLIYCSLPGFSARDPRAGMRAWEGILGAATGCYRPSPAGTPGRPVYSAVPFSSMFGAFLAAVHIAACLSARTKTGKGQQVEVPLFNATFNAIGTRGLKLHTYPSRNMSSKPRHMLCKDGRWFMFFWGNKKFEALLDEMGGTDWHASGLRREEIDDKFRDLFLTRSAEEWEQMCAQLNAEGSSCIPSTEWLEHPQALASGAVADFEDPEIGPFRGPGINIRLSDTPGRVNASRPVPDAHRAAILEQLANRKQAPRRLASAAAAPMQSALQGIRVLDLSIKIAGPTCGRTLAELGADVIKIDSPHRSLSRNFNDTGRGKRSIVLDLKTERGMQIFWRLVDTADVILENFRMGVTRKLGIDYESVRIRRPGIVYCSIDTFGQSGPFAGRPGREHIAQAITGMQVRYGGSQKPVLAPFNVVDYGTGLMGCYAILLALLHRNQSGTGQHVDTALIYTATMLQSNLLQRHAGKQWNEPRGQDALGTGPLCRAYQAADGWLFMAALPGQIKACPELADITESGDRSLESALEQRFREKDLQTWVKALTGAGISAHRVVPGFPELMEDPVVRAHGLSVTRFHEVIGAVTTTGPAVAMSQTPVRVGKPAPHPGSDAAAILEELGLLPEMDNLVREQVVFLDKLKAG